MIPTISLRLNCIIRFEWLEVTRYIWHCYVAIIFTEQTGNYCWKCLVIRKYILEGGGGVLGASRPIPSYTSLPSISISYSYLSICSSSQLFHILFHYILVYAIIRYLDINEKYIHFEFPCFFMRVAKWWIFGKLSIHRT